MTRRHAELRRTDAGADLFTAPRGIDRLLALMAGWWQGRSLADMGAQFGISRTRVRVILLRVGCMAALRAAALERQSPRTHRPAPAARATNARAILQSPRVRRLTRRQLAAVAWSAQSLSLPAIALRMNVSPQRVQLLLTAAKRRINPVRPPERAPLPDALPALCWDDLIDLPPTPCEDNRPCRTP